MKNFVLLGLIGVVAFWGNAQEKDFVQTYNAGKLLKQGQHDVFLFSSTYTETSSNWLGVTSQFNRQTFARQWLQITRGVSVSGRVNLGLDIQLVNTHRSSNSTDRSEIFQAYSFQNGPNARVGIGAIGLRARVQPFAEVADFTIQSSLTLPGIRHPEGFSSTDVSQNLFWADWNRVTSWNQFFYTLDFDKSQLFMEADLLFRFPTLSTQIPMLDLPVTLIYSRFIKDFTVYGLAQNMQRFVSYNPNPSDFVIPAAFAQVGLGMKYNWSNGLQFEASWNKFVRAVNSGKGESYNLGLRYIFGS